MYMRNFYFSKLNNKKKTFLNIFLSILIEMSEKLKLVVNHTILTRNLFIYVFIVRLNN